MRRISDQTLRGTQDVLEWIIAGLLLTIGLAKLPTDWLTGLPYLALAVLVGPRTSRLRWLKVLIALIVLLLTNL